MISCYVCGEPCNFDEASLHINGEEVRSISFSKRQLKLRLCPKCMRLLYLSYTLSSQGTLPDGSWVEIEETEANG